MKFENEPTDDQLDKLLRDVEVPQDLNALLKAIPSQTIQQRDDSEDSVGLSDRRSSKGKLWFGLVLVASLTGIGLFVASQFLPNSDGESPVAKGHQGSVHPEQGSIVGPVNDATNSLAEIENLELMEIEAQIHAIEVAQLEAQLLRVESRPVEIDQRELESMIAAMTEEYSIPLGMPEAKVKLRMVQVIQQYPGTRGAAIAESYLESAN